MNSEEKIAALSETEMVVCWFRMLETHCGVLITPEDCELRDKLLRLTKPIPPVEKEVNGERVKIIFEADPDADIKRDVERYRFLRDEDNWGEDSGDDWGALGEVHAEQFDAIVDARMGAVVDELHNVKIKVTPGVMLNAVVEFVPEELDAFIDQMIDIVAAKWRNKDA